MNTANVKMYTNDLILGGVGRDGFTLIADAGLNKRQEFVDQRSTNFWGLFRSFQG